MPHTCCNTLLCIVWVYTFIQYPRKQYLITYVMELLKTYSEAIKKKDKQVLACNFTTISLERVPTMTL